ncbi:MAG TPA: hypothetical protein DEB74_18405 [Lachnospiraceae bacterium]|nr:hypothetical protein [Lachnospiraceae bacterium]
MQNKIVVIHQPDFIPYLGFFDRLLKADIYVVLDNVQYVRHTSRSWTSRDKIKTKNGEKWITISTQKAPMDTSINQILLSKENNWRENNINLIRENYKKSPYFYEIMPYIEKLYHYDCNKMIDFNLQSIRILMMLFDIHIEMVLASSLNPEGKNNNLIIDIINKLKCNKYLSGIGAKDYFIPELYEKAGIQVIWQDFKHPIYQQQYEGFISHLSSIDLLFNCGIEESRNILRRGNEYEGFTK